MMDWKGIVEKILVAVIAGAILGAGAWAFNRMQTPDPQILKARIDWVDISNPLYMNSDAKRVDAIDAAGVAAFGVRNLGRIIQVFKSESTLRVGTLHISNDTSTRSKETEIIAGGGVVFSDASNQNGILQGKVTIKPIEPHKSADALYMVVPWYSFSTPPVSLIHDNRLVELDTRQLPDSIPFSTDTIEAYLLALFGFAGVGVVILVILIIAGLIQLLVKDKVRFQAKLLTAAQIQKQVEILNYIRDNFPEKYPAINKPT